MTYDEWLETVPPEITDDALWQMTLYLQALFLGEIAWHDVSKLTQDRRTLRLSDQLYQATGKISTNITEGYSKASGKDQASFYKYALDSAREARDWYYKARNILGNKVAIHRMQLIVPIIRQLLKLIPEHRGRKIREETASYKTHPINELLNNLPMSNDYYAIRNTE